MVNKFFSAFFILLLIFSGCANDVHYDSPESKGGVTDKPEQKMDKFP